MKDLPESASDYDSNPYRSPTAIDDANSPVRHPRAAALLRFRIAIAFLLVAALVNAFFLPRYAYIPRYQVSQHEIRFLVVIFIGAIGFLAISCTFEVLERLAKLLRRVLAPNSDPLAWNNAIYRAFRPAIGLGLAGALLWIVWVVAFFEFKMNFDITPYTVSPAHLLAASLYAPLIYGWVKAANRLLENHEPKVMNRLRRSTSARVPRKLIAVKNRALLPKTSL